MRPKINSTVILNTGQFKDIFHRGDTKSSLCAQTPKLNGAVALCYQLPDDVVPQLNLIESLSTQTIQGPMSTLGG